MQDTATSLGLSLSPHMIDERDPIIATMMNAIFDTGYYKEMRLLNVDGHELVFLSNPVKMEGVPEWLITLLPMKTATADTEISSGWNIAGTLYVTSNPSFGYLKLYEQVKEMLLYSSLMFVGAFILLMMVLQLTLKPLRAIQKQATEISNGQFTLIEELPVTKEVRAVALSMNGMSKKIGDRITQLTARLETLLDSLKRDPLTHLLNYENFNVAIKSTLAAGQTGYVFFIKIEDLATHSRNLGNIKVDVLIRELADLLSQTAHCQNKAYRLYGSEFALITDKINETVVTDLANQLKENITHLGQKYEIDDMVHMGIVRFDKTSEFDRLMPALVEAYEQARNIGHNDFYIKPDSISSMSEQSWHDTILRVIDEQSPEIQLTNEAYNYASEHPVKVLQEAFTVVRDPNGEPLSIGTFFSVAQEFKLAEALDKTIINKVISMIESENITTPVTINLSMDSVASSTFKSWIAERLNDTDVSKKLIVFSVTAYAATKDLMAFDSFCDFIESTGFEMLLKRYSSDTIPLDMLNQLHIDYIRLGRDLTTDIDQYPAKADSITMIQDIAQLLDVKVVAESVKSDADFEFVKEAGIYGISR
jgi:EAL domain-containing protein (putative c-di-GMP-specific phosphodiesterase class I)/GGDEF domain-containing protein